MNIHLRNFKNELIRLLTSSITFTFGRVQASLTLLSLIQLFTYSLWTFRFFMFVGGDGDGE